MEESKVLDGFVRLVDHMGNDLDIEQAARVSYAKGTRKVSDTESLIRYLMRHGHYSPIEQVEFKFHIKAPLFVFGQLVRHRTANLNVRSYRYSEFEEEFCYLDETRYVKQSTNNKQQSAQELIELDYSDFDSRQRQTNSAQMEIYNELISKGCAREVARIHLPQSAYTEFFWKMDLRNLLHFLKLRLGKNAQQEITLYAEAISKVVKDICPITWRAFEDYELNSVKLTRRELKSIQSGRVSMDDLLIDGYSKREADELISKLGD